MEFAGQLRPSGACNLLGVPGLSSPDVDDDEGDIVIGIRPKSSPLPRRRSSLSDEDLELVPPPCGSRRVSFADAAGLDLVQVKEFDIWDVPKLPDYDSREGREKDSEEYFISPSNFCLPVLPEELFAKVRDQKVELETVELLPGTTILRGVIRVLNVSFDKAVYVRTSLDSWSSHFDLLAEYIPGSSQGLMDCFSFRLTLIPPFREQGARVDFCLRYETPVGTFWANNDSRNYTLFCHQRAKEERAQRENVKKKSCLKTVSQTFSSVENNSAVEAPCLENNKTDVSKQREEETLKMNETVDEQSGTSEGDDQLLPTKSRRSSSRRSRRKAARMARVRDYFSQRNGEDDPEKDGPPPETRSEQKPLPESQIVSDVLQETSPARDDNSSNHTERSESVDSSDSSALRGGESATQNKILQSGDEPVSAENQNISRSGSGAEESAQKEDVCCESRHDSADEPLDGSVSAASNGSFTFGTVVAPLYHQAFVSVNQGTLTSTLNVDDERRERCTALEDASDSIHDAPGSESDDASPHYEASLQLSDDIVNSVQAPKTIPAETEEHPNPAGISRTDVSDALILAEGSDLLGREQERDLTPDPQRQTTAETCMQVQTEPGTNESFETLKSSEFSGRVGHETEQEASRSDEREEDETDNVSEDSATVGKDATECQAPLETQEDVESPEYEDVIGFCSAEASEFKNWEMMVEEDEMNLLTDDEEISIQAGDIEAVEEDDIEQVEDAGRETLSEQAEATAEEEEEKEEDEAASCSKEKQVEDQEKETTGEECDTERFEDVGRENIPELKDATAEEESALSKETEDQAVNVQVGDQEEETAGGEEVMDVGTDRDLTETLTNVRFDASLANEEGNHAEGNDDGESRGGVELEDGENVAVCLEERPESSQNEAEDEREEFQIQPTSTTDEDGSSFADGASCVFYENLDDDETSVGSASSDSDDEVELYMHCLRAVHTGPQLNKDSGFGVGRRSSVNRSKLLSTPMPSISESVDEEQNLGGLQEDLNGAWDYEFTAAAPEEENLRPVSWWRETFSCRNMGKSFLFAVLFLLFLVVAHHYDFLACFGLYLMSLVWLWFQGDRQKVNSGKRIS